MEFSLQITGDGNWIMKLILTILVEEIASHLKLWVYYINDHLNKFNVRIIDTPEFGDTKGINVDYQFTNKYEVQFSEISGIDYILLTINQQKLDLKQDKYLYDRVQQIFWKDAKDRFIFMSTLRW